MKILITLLASIICIAAAAQQTIRLQITDKATKEPLPYATVQIVGSTKSVVADKEGFFNIPEKIQINVSSVGYGSQTFRVAAGTSTLGLSASTNEMQDVVVSTTRNNVIKRNIPQQVTVISAKNIESTGAKDLTDVLKKTAGLDIIQYTSILSGVSIRGFRPQFSGINQRTLILVDGKPGGITNLATVDMLNIDRVEVVKGAASALYGSQAMGGVVNLISKKSKGEITKSLFVSYGSFNTIEAGFTAGGSISSKTDFNASIKYNKQKDDIVYGSDNFFRNKFGYTTVTNTYRNANFITDSIRERPDTRGDGSTRPYTAQQYNAGSIRFGHQITDNWRVDVGAEYYSGFNVQSPGDLSDGITNQASKNPFRYSSNIAFAGSIGPHNITGKLYGATEVSNNIPRANGFITSITTNKFYGFQLQDNFSFKNTNITFGLDRNKVSSTPQRFSTINALAIAPSAPAYGIYSTAGFINTNSDFFNDRLIFTLGGRLDNIDFDVRQTPLLETFKTSKKSYSVFSPSAGIKFKSPQNIDVHASIGQAFVTPDAFNVAGYSVSGPGASLSVIGRVNVSYGNPDLKPERSTTWDAGISFFKKEYGLDVDITYFNTVVKDRITQGPTIPVPISSAELTDDKDTILSKVYYINADNSHQNGVEIAASFDIGAFSNYNYSLRLYANATRFFQLEESLLDRTITTSQVFRTRNITNVADLTLTYGIEYAAKGFATRLSGRHVGKRFDTDFSDVIKRPEVEYAKLMLLDFSTTVPIAAKSKLIAQVNNITDENYYEKRGFNQPGRNFTIKYIYTF